MVGTKFCFPRLEFPRTGCDYRRPWAAKLRQCHWCGEHTHRNPRDLHLGRAEFLFWVPLSIIGSTDLEIELKEHSERLHLELQFTATREGRLAMHCVLRAKPQHVTSLCGSGRRFFHLRTVN